MLARTRRLLPAIPLLPGPLAAAMALVSPVSLVSIVSCESGAPPGESTSGVDGGAVPRGDGNGGPADDGSGSQDDPGPAPGDPAGDATDGGAVEPELSAEPDPAPEAAGDASGDSAAPPGDAGDEPPGPADVPPDVPSDAGPPDVPPDVPNEAGPPDVPPDVPNDAGPPDVSDDAGDGAGDGDAASDVPTPLCLADLDCEDADPCTSDTCDDALGCVYAPVPGCCHEDAECDDADPCTGLESCADHACVPGAPPDCVPSGSCFAASCEPGTGCVETLLRGCLPCVEGADCDDAEPCNGLETCLLGACEPGTPPSCDDGDPCTSDACDDGTGCTAMPVEGCCEEDADCDDGDLCNGAESCFDLACEAGLPLECAPAGACFEAGCDPGAGCFDIALPGCTPCSSSADCVDADPCNGVEFCLFGACAAGEPLACDDGIACTANDCTPGQGCSHPAIPGCVPCGGAGDCDDGNECTGLETCEGGKCQAGTPMSCSDGNPCTLDKCFAGFGCENPLVKGCCNVDADCADADLCDGGEVCIDHKCFPVDGKVVCTPSNACVTSSCDPAAGCVETPIPGCKPCTTSGSCQDGNVCNGQEVCEGGKCTAGPPLPCPPSNACMTAGCDPGKGCTEKPIPGCVPCESDGECLDADLCNGQETCTGGKCKAGPPLSCADGDVCTDDLCDPSAGCVLVPVDGCCNHHDECQDADPCNGIEICGNHVCYGGPPPNCTSKKGACFDGFCEPGVGCKEVQKPGCKTCEYAADCNDQNACNGSESCIDKACVSGTPLVCQPTQACHSSKCVPSIGCFESFIPGCCTFDESCQDGDACNGYEVCQNGTCSPGPAPDCQPLDACTVASCEPQYGCVYDYLDGCEACESDNDCQDGDSCGGTQGYCLFGVCQDGEPWSGNCDDGLECTSDECDPDWGCIHISSTGSSCGCQGTCQSDGSCQEGTGGGCNQCCSGQNNGCLGSQGNCYCDEACVGFGDCCSNYQCFCQ